MQASTSSLSDVGRLLVTCPDRPGIVASVTQFLFEAGANLLHADQHTAPGESGEGGVFYMRAEFWLPEVSTRLPALEEAFRPIAAMLGMQARFALAARRKRLAVFASRAPHALLELLWASESGDLQADVALVIANHPDLAPVAERWKVPFHHVPYDAARRDECEQAQQALLDAAGGVDAIVLARYMRILSPAFVARYPQAIINIHHSFLPAFVGADPYARAYERGVKLIGATAHYVTDTLDEGPIIEQAVSRVDHRHGPEDLRRLGRLVERTVLARAVAWHVEDRILVHGNHTIVFA